MIKTKIKLYSVYCFLKSVTSYLCVVVTHIEVCNKIPVMAFGHALPNLKSEWVHASISLAVVNVIVYLWGVYVDCLWQSLRLRIWSASAGPEFITENLLDLYVIKI